MSDIIMTRRNLKRIFRGTQFVDGQTFRGLISSLNSSVRSFTRTTTAPASGTSTVNAAADGLPEILCWASDNTVYWYSEESMVYLAEDASGMFSGLTNLITANLMWILTSKTKHMSEMFSGCTRLYSVIMDAFDTKRVLDFDRMFYGCSNMQSVDISAFERNPFVSAISAEDMFTGCSSLLKIYASATFHLADNTGVTMFGNCRMLRGGAGTAWDSSHTDGAYAKIDNGTYSPGYFSERT